MGIVWTLRARGLAPSLGAGGSLVVAALCCLILGTAVLTFRDWPERGDTSPGGSITMTPPAAKAAGRAASGPSAPFAASVVVAAPARDRATGARPVRRSTPRRGAAAPPAPAGTNPPPAAAPAPAAPAPAAAAPQPAAAAPPSAPVAQPQAPAPAAGPVEGVVETVREVEKPLPPVVQQPIQPVLDTVQEVGRTVDETTGPLLPKLP